MISVLGLNYDLWMVGQVVIAFIMYKKFNKVVSRLNSLNTLVLIPMAPILALVLFVLSRVKDKDYFIGYIFLLPLIVLTLMMKEMGPIIIVFSIMITTSVYAIYEITLQEDGTPIINRLLAGCRPIIVSLVIGYLCKGMDNPISFIICCNVFSDYIVRQFTTTVEKDDKGKVISHSCTNKFKWSRNGYDNDGNNYNLLAGLLQASFIGAPTDIVGRSKSIVNGLADALCVVNVLISGSKRGAAGIVVSDWSTALIFASLIVLIYLYGNLEYIKEVDKVWPPVITCNVPYISKLHLLIVTITLVCSYTLSSSDIGQSFMLISKLVIVTTLCCFARIKTITSMFFSANMLF